MREDFFNGLLGAVSLLCERVFAPDGGPPVRLELGRREAVKVRRQGLTNRSALLQTLDKPRKPVTTERFQVRHNTVRKGVLVYTDWPGVVKQIADRPTITHILSGQKGRVLGVGAPIAQNSLS